MIFLTMISLLQAVVQSQHQHHEGLLINRLNNFFDFDHNIFFLDPLTHNYLDIPYRDNNADNFAPQTVYVFHQDNHLDVNGTEVAALPSVSGNTFLIVVVEASQFEISAQLLARVKEIRMLHVNVKIGVFFTGNVTSTVVVEKLFRWSWSVGIANIFCTFYSSIDSDASSSFNVFRFDPFRTFHLINLTGSESLQNYFPDKAPNYRKHPIRMALATYIGFDGFGLRLWTEIKIAFNASVSLISLTLKDVQDKGYYESEEGCPFDNTIHLSHHVRLNGTKILFYPLRIGGTVLLVPHAKQRSGITGYIQNATWKLIFVFTFVAVTAASLFLTVSGYLKTRKICLLQKVVDVVNLLLNDNGTINYGQLNRAEVFIIMPLTFIGLIVMNGILSAFQSFLTLPLYERQINSIENLFLSSVPIIEDDSPYWLSRTNGLLEHASQHDGWKDRMIRKDFQDEADKFNDSIAFFLLDSQAQIYLEAQKQLNLKAYHLVTGVSFDTFYTIYQVCSGFPFIDRINDIVHRLKSAGLIDKWFEYEDDEMIDSLKVRNPGLKTADNETDYSELAVLGIGWIASGVVFICELIWNKLKTRVDNLNNNFFVPSKRC